jgi:probable phosphoglycerate mutase
LVADIRRRFPEAYQQRGRELDTYRPPDGESFSDLGQRVIPFFEQIAEQNNNNILIVAHAGVNRVILCHILGMPLTNLFRLEIPYGAITRIDNVGGLFTLRLMMNNFLWPDSG